MLTGAALLGLFLQAPVADWTDWELLDRDIAELQEVVAAPANGWELSGVLRTRYSFINPTSTPVDVSGFTLDNARVYFRGGQGDWNYVVSAELAGGGALVTDAYASLAVDRDAEFVFGSFRQPFQRSFLTPEERLVLLDRTLAAQMLGVFDLGLMLRGRRDEFAWWMAIQNGTDQQENETLVTVRVEWDAIGEGVPFEEGAIGAPVETRLTLGAAGFDAGTVPDGSALLADVALTRDRLAAFAEVMELDRDLPGRGTPFSLTLSYLLVRKEWEAALRYDDLDDPFGSTALTFGINWYRAGHDAKWQLNVISRDARLGGVDGHALAIGVTVGARSGPLSR